MANPKMLFPGRSLTRGRMQCLVGLETAFRRLSIPALLLGLLLVAGPSRSEEAQPSVFKSFDLKLPAQTLGGLMLWADELAYYDWRIQRNTLTGHHRLLDGDSRRRAWGSFQSCHAKLKEIQREENLPPMTGKAVLVLHGLADVRVSAEGFAKYLHDEGGYLALAIGYPSIFDDIGQHARSLASVIEHLDGVRGDRSRGAQHGQPRDPPLLGRPHRSGQWAQAQPAHPADRHDRTAQQRGEAGRAVRR